MSQASDDMSAQPTLPRAERRPLSSVAARMLARAKKEFADRQFENAEQSLTNVLALAPDEPDAMRTLGMVAQRRSDHVKAADCFRRVLAEWPQDSDLRVCLGIALYEQGKVDEAVKHLRLACELSPTSAPAWFNLGEALGREAHSHEAVAALQRGFRWHACRRVSAASKPVSPASAKCCAAIPATPKAGSVCRI
jgi:Tfp pilus assembly protein PilF